MGQFGSMSQGLMHCVTNKKGHPTTNGRWAKCTQGHNPQPCQCTLWRWSIPSKHLHTMSWQPYTGDPACPNDLLQRTCSQQTPFWLSCCDPLILLWQIQRVMHLGTCQLVTHSTHCISLLSRLVITSNQLAPRGVGSRWSLSSPGANSSRRRMHTNSL